MGRFLGREAVNQRNILIAIGLGVALLVLLAVLGYI
jgi:hypothetical protein